MTSSNPTPRDIVERVRECYAAAAVQVSSGVCCATSSCGGSGSLQQDAVAGALETATYERLLRDAGFEDVSIQITRRYTIAEAALDPAILPSSWEAGDGKLASAFVRARKPDAALIESTARRSVPLAQESAGCCGGGCCGG